MSKRANERKSACRAREAKTNSAERNKCVTGASEQAQIGANGSVLYDYVSISQSFNPPCAAATAVTAVTRGQANEKWFDVASSRYDDGTRLHAS